MNLGEGLADLEGRRGFCELSAAVESSEIMEESLGIIECQNDTLEERRRMRVMAARGDHRPRPASRMTTAGRGDS